MNQQYVQYGAHNGVDVSGAQFPSNPYGAVTQPGPYHQQQQQHHQQQLYPAILPATQQQQQQTYFQSIDPGHTQQQQQQQQQRAHLASRQPTQQQYGHQSIASPASGPGAPPPDFNSPSPVQYGGLANNVRQEVANDDDDDDDDGGAQPDANDPEPVFHLPPPPEGTYQTQEALEEAIHSWTLEHGYELVRRASKKNAKGVLYKRYMHCSKHGKAANTGKLTDETRQRVNRKSSRMNCPMSIAVVAIDPLNTEGQWQVRHRKTHHNHGPLDALNLAGHRRRARAGGIEQAVDGLFAIGTPTAQVLQFLQRTNPHGLFTRTDVANMKLKYKKFGTCLVKADTATTHGRPCNECRARKIKCNNRRPTCAACRDTGKTCVYDHPPEDIENANGAEDAGPEMGDDMEDEPDQTNVNGEPQVAVPGRRRPRGQLSAFQQNAQRAEAILATLQAFQTEHVTPTRLDFQSSAVEILAASSCGSGESYRNVPVLTSVNDWPTYRDLMTEACMKENTFDVLIAAKSEPTQPPSDCKVEEWNEYVKKLAIFKRRNDALTAALWGTLSPTFRSRVQKLRKAAEIWAVLEDVCLPQGSQTGFKLFSDLHSITHANSADLKDYILRLENAYTAFNSLSTHWHAQHEVSTGSRPAPPSTSNTTANTHSAFSTLHTPHPAAILAPAQDIFSEEMLCFLFLRNLAPEFQRWVDSLCATNNIAGFGTGPQLRFVELSKRAVEFEISVRARTARQGGAG